MLNNTVSSFSSGILAVTTTKFWQWVPTVASMESKSVALFLFDGER